MFQSLQRMVAAAFFCVGIPCVSVAAEVRPNVVFIVVDDLNDWVGCLHGHPQAVTPNIDRLAARGVLFANAHCAAPLCNPSRTSLWIGKHPAVSEVLGNNQDWRLEASLRDVPTLPQHLRGEGYLTAGCGKLFHANHGGPTGALTGGHGGRQGFNHPASWVRRHPAPDVQLPLPDVLAGQNMNGLDVWHWDWGPTDSSDAETIDGRTVAWACDFLAEEHTQPFFLAVGVYRPHSPWYNPTKYFAQFPLEQILLPQCKPDDVDDLPTAAVGYLKNSNHFHRRILDGDLWQSAVQAYLSSIAVADAMVGKVLDALDASGQTENTIVVLCSDHGWHLGEKQRWHKSTLWEDATRVPLIVVAPGVTQPHGVCTRPVSLVDLYPTCVELCRAAPVAANDGRSLLPLLENPAAAWTGVAITSRQGGDHAVRDEHWRYIRYRDGSQELYDHRVDPHEWTNLADRAGYEDVIDRLAAHLPEAE